jgi:ubiquinone/menaquinone biosynthesis C-methylase UbiE
VILRPAQRVYGALADHYDERWAHYVQRSVSRSLAALRVPADARVLDIACGTGVLLAQVQHLEPTARSVGVDVTHAMLHVAAGRLRGLPLVQGSGDSLPFANASFDCVVTTSALHYVEQPAMMLAEMKRVLAPGGAAIITDWCADFATMRVLDVGLRSVLRPLDRAHQRVLQATELTQLMREAGFATVTVERWKLDRFWGMMTARGT